MEEKERYKLESYNGAFSEIHDTELDEWFLNKQPVTELLNRQDKRIKELEAHIEKLENAEAVEIVEANKKAVSVLKELRFAFNESIGNGMLRNYVCCLIDDKIKELKGER